MGRYASLSALQLSRDLKINKNTAWRIAMQIRKAMSQAEQHKLLTGIIALVDEATGFEKSRRNVRLPPFLRNLLPRNSNLGLRRFPMIFTNCSTSCGAVQAQKDINKLTRSRTIPTIWFMNASPLVC